MKKILLQEIARVVANKRLGGDHFKLVLCSKGIASSAAPGQFIQIRVSLGMDPLLRRPISIHRVGAGTLELLCEIVGKATMILSEARPGDELDLIGPLGNGFGLGCAKAPVLVAGGMGVAPLAFLAEKLSKLKPLVLIGARSKKQVLCVDEFRKFGCKVMTATDDGSLGLKGRVTQLLENVLKGASGPRVNIYACGPRPMLKELSRLSVKYNVPAEISLEEHMSCGIGACLGCVVGTKSGFKRVCKEGPVFDAGEVIWQEE